MIFRQDWAESFFLFGEFSNLTNFERWQVLVRFFGGGRGESKVIMWEKIINFENRTFPAHLEIG